MLGANAAPFVAKNPKDVAQCILTLAVRIKRLLRALPR
jgi:hypothetical protein